MTAPVQTPTTEKPAPSGVLGTAAVPKTEGEPKQESKPGGEPKTEPSKTEKPWHETEGFTFKLADDLVKAGFELDADTLKEFAPIAKELKIDDAAHAQKLVDVAAKLVQKHALAQAQAIEERSAKWLEETKADKEIGGDKLDATAEAAVKVALKYGGEDFLKQLVDLKFENSPHLLRFLARVAKATADDTFTAETRGDGAADDAEANRASRLYGPEFNKSFGKE